MVGQLGVPFADSMGWVVGAVECFGGLGILLGLLFPISVGLNVLNVGGLLVLEGWPAAFGPPAGRRPSGVPRGPLDPGRDPVAVARRAGQVGAGHPPSLLNKTLQFCGVPMQCLLPNPATVGEVLRTRMKRREFVEKAGIGAAALALGTQGGHASAATHEQLSHNSISGPLATATVSFGAWASIPAGGRLGGDGRLWPTSAMIPNQVTIKAGGTVNFMIAGFHVVAVYDDGTQPGSINTGITSPPINATVPPIIEDENNRIYRGIDPTAMPFLQGPMQKGPVGPAFQPLLQDRIEVVQFPDPGTLVICRAAQHRHGDVRVNESGP